MGVVAGAVDEAGVPAVLEALADDVHAGCVGHAACLAEDAVVTGDGQVDPVVVRVVAGGQDDGADPFAAQIEPGRRARCGDGRRSDWRQDLAGQAGAVDVAVDGVQQGVHAPVGVRGEGCELVAEPCGVALQALETAGESDPTTLEGGQVDAALVGVRVGASGQLKGWFAAGGCGVGHLVDGAGEPAGGLQPPEDVHPAVAAGHPGVPPGGQDDVAARSCELVGDLHPRGRGTHDQDPSRIQLARVSVPVAGDHRYVGAPDRSRYQGPAMRAGGHDDRARPPRGVVGVHVVAAGGSGGQPGHRRTGHDGCVERCGVLLELVHEVPGAQEAVRVTLGAPPGQSGHPGGAEQAQRVPAFGPPALAHSAAVEDDVFAAGECEQSAHRQAGVAGSDHDGVDVVRGSHGVSSGPDRPRPVGRDRSVASEVGAGCQPVTTSIATCVGWVSAS